MCAVKKALEIPSYFSTGYFQGNQIVGVDTLARALSKIKDLCICIRLWTKTWQKCTATVLCRAVWVDWGSTAVFLSHHYSLLSPPPLPSASHSSALWLRRSGEINKGGPHSFTLKHTLAVAHTQDNVRGSSRNAIRGSEICPTELQENIVHSPVKEKRTEYNSTTRRGGGDGEGRDLIFDSVKWTVFVRATLRLNGFQKLKNPEKSAQVQMVIEIEQQLINPMHESALSKGLLVFFLALLRQLSIFSFLGSTLNSEGCLPAGTLHCCHSDRIRQRQAAL